MRRTMHAAALMLLLFTAACGGGTSEGVTIELNTPPRSLKGASDNTLEVTVRDGSEPVTDADVKVELFMAAMPSMNMAEMRNTIPLAHQAEGRYTGTGSVSMAGDWDAIVTVTRGGSEVARRTFEVHAE